MEKTESMKHMDWRQKVLISILSSFIIIMSLLFYITYHYFVVKIENSNKKETLLTFEQAEQDLKDILKDAELCLDKYVTDDNVWEFGYEYPDNDIKESKLKIKITDDFCNEMSVNREIASLGILRGDGWGIASSTEGRNCTGKTNLTGALLNALTQSQENYPYTTWFPSWKFQIDQSGPVEMMLQRPALVGIKSTGEADTLKKDSFLIVTIGENNIQNTYKSVALNGGMAALIDNQNQIISNIGEDLSGQKYHKKDDTQYIEYPLELYGWKLCNMIPKEEYMKEINDIRNFGFFMILLAITATAAVAVAWSRKYTRPIELLMENMHHVKKQEFDIEQPPKLGWAELDQLNEELYFTAQSIKKYIVRLKQAEHEKTREELLALQYQMNPHFLLNSLNSIRWMAMMTNNNIVADTLVKLGKIITPMLRNPSLIWKIENEIEFLENYVSMMQLRYGHDMEYQMTCPEKLYDEEFPRLILQPLIENGFVHGSSSEEVRTIHVIISCKDNIEVEVLNSGVFFSEEELQKIRAKMKSSLKDSEHIGLANVSKRLNLLYGEQGSMTMKTDDERGFVINISFPGHMKILDKT